MATDPALVFYNQSNRTDHADWSFDTTGYLQRSTTDLYNAIKKTIDEEEKSD